MEIATKEGVNVIADFSEFVKVFGEITKDH